MLTGGDSTYRAIVDAMNEGAATVSANGTILYANPCLGRMVGQPAAELVGTAVLDLTSVPRRDVLAQLLDVGDRESDRGEVTLAAANGKTVPVMLGVSGFAFDGTLLRCLVMTDLTAAREAEWARAESDEALRASEDQYRTLFEYAPIGIAHVALDGELVQVNPRFCEIFGYGADEVPGLRVEELVHPDDRARDRANVARLLSGEIDSYRTERRDLKKDGSVVWVESAGTLARDSDGRPLMFVRAVRDITEQRQIQDELVRMSELLERTQEISRTGGWEYDVANGRASWTHEVYRIYGIDATHGPLNIAEAIAAYDAESAPIIEAAFERLVTDGEPYDLELGLIRVDGQRVWVRTSGRPVIEDGRVVGARGNIVDVTDRKQAESELSASEERFRVSIESLPDGFTLFSAVRDSGGRIVDFRYEFVNQSMCRLRRTDYGRTIGRTVLECYDDPSYRPDEWIERYAHVVETGEPWIAEAFPFETVLDGNRISGYADLRVFKAGDGCVVAMRDVTAQRQTEEQLRASSAYARSLIEASLDPLVTISPEGKITDVNEATTSATGRSREELIGTDFADYFTEPDLARAGYERVFIEGSVTDYALTIRGGHPTPVLYNASLYRDPEGHVLGVFAAARDVTAQRKAESEVNALNAELEARVAQRTAELERSNQNLEAFTYSVSHDLRAPLRALSGFSEALLDDYGDLLDETGRGYATRIVDASERMAKLIDDLLHLSRISRAEIHLEMVNLSAEVASIAAELQRREPDRCVRFVVQDAIHTTADRVLIRTVLENLLENAWKFTAGRNEAVIEFGTAPVDDAPTCCYLRDNGAGFDAAYVDKLFQPFQRLHPAREFPGTGIGLASVRRIVERHGGRTWAEGAVDRGATFWFTLDAEDTQ